VQGERQPNILAVTDTCESWTKTDASFSRRGLEWGGASWSALVTLQVIEHFYSSSPFLALIGPPRVALLITAAACAGFAIRGEEKLIGAARKPLLEKAKADAAK